MPRAYTNQERDAITEQLMKVGEEAFSRLGLRKTTIDDLVQGARIAKGSFYQFFDSKEDLFLAIQERIETRSFEQIQKKLRSLERDPPAMVRAFFKACLDSLDDSPFLRQLNDPEILHRLMRSAPPERLERMKRQNDSLYRKLFQGWVDRGLVRKFPAKTIQHMLMVLFLVKQNHNAFGNDSRRVLSWLVDAIVAHAVVKP